MRIAEKSTYGHKVVFNIDIETLIGNNNFFWIYVYFVVVLRDKTIIVTWAVQK